MRNRNSIKAVSFLLRNCQDVRRTASPVLDISFVGMGRLDANTETLFPWDVAAAGLIATEAGAERSFLEPVPDGIPPDLFLVNRSSFRLRKSTPSLWKASVHWVTSQASGLDNKPAVYLCPFNVQGPDSQHAPARSVVSLLIEEPRTMLAAGTKEARLRQKDHACRSCN